MIAKSYKRSISRLIKENIDRILLEREQNDFENFDNSMDMEDMDPDEMMNMDKLFGDSSLGSDDSMASDSYADYLGDVNSSDHGVSANDSGTMLNRSSSNEGFLKSCVTLKYKLSRIMAQSYSNDIPVPRYKTRFTNSVDFYDKTGDACRPVKSSILPRAGFVYTFIINDASRHGRDFLEFMTSETGANGMLKASTGGMSGIILDDPNYIKIRRIDDSYVIAKFFAEDIQGRKYLEGLK